MNKNISTSVAVRFKSLIRYVYESSPSHTRLANSGAKAAQGSVEPMAKRWRKCWLSVCQTL
jgi:hypothetical protein